MAPVACTLASRLARPIAVCLAGMWLSSASVAEEPPANWPDGYVLFDCVLQDGSHEEAVQAFFDDIGGSTWNKYLIMARNFEEFQALFVTGGYATLDPLLGTWSRRHDAVTVDGTQYPPFVEVFSYHQLKGGGFLITSTVNGQPSRICTSVNR